METELYIRLVNTRPKKKRRLKMKNIPRLKLTFNQYQLIVLLEE